MVKKGQAIRVRCDDESGNNESINSFVWKHDGKLLQKNTNILFFQNADPDVAGNYSCTVKNVAGAASALFSIIIICEYLKL